MKKHVNVLLSFILALSLLVTLPAVGDGSVAASAGVVYEVGPGKAYETVSEIPFESLNPGDTVKIHYREEPYKEKFVISRMGAEDAPITISGVPGPNGELPVIDGNGATTREGLSFWNDNRSVIKVGGARFPGNASDPNNGILPKHIIIENLEIRGAREEYTFTDSSGVTKPYLRNASPIYIEYGHDIVLRNNIITDGGNGLFVASGEAGVSSDILVEGNYIYGNGVVGRILEHNIYSAAVGITFQYNRIGELCDGCRGNNLKDRSAGTVIRYNWIEGGNRQLDLVEGGFMTQFPEYRETHVYGNVLISPDDERNPQMIHYGGDNGAVYDEDWNIIDEDNSSYRKGTLYLYNNTMITDRSTSTTVVRLSSDAEHADIRNNIIYKSVPESELYIVNHTGTVDMSHNWISEGWQTIATPNEVPVFAPAIINDDGTTISGNLKFVDVAGQDYRLLPGSQVVNAGTALHPNALDVTMQYVKHQAGTDRFIPGARPADTKLDIGAFELPTGRDLGEYLKNINNE